MAEFKYIYKEAEPRGKVFPIQERAVRKSLGAIYADPKKAYSESRQALAVQNIELAGRLSTVVNYLKGEDPENVKNFREGAIFTYTMLRVNAGLSGKRPPKLTDKDLGDWITENLENNPDKDTKDFITCMTDKWDKFAEEEKELAKGIAGLTQGDPQPEGYYAGAYFMASLFKRQQEVKELYEQLGDIDFEIEEN